MRAWWLMVGVGLLGAGGCGDAGQGEDADTATGGAWLSTGGALPVTGGGYATGGWATGGAYATGGWATGGEYATGGWATGGLGTGGWGTGGWATGGLGTGGASGGSATGGEGTGGAPTPVYEYGFAPATVTAADAQAAYDAWKAVHLENCGDGRYRVRWENARLDATVSEGIGYGMLLTVAYDDQEAFDGLFDYYQAALTGNGLMHWLRYGCDAHYDTKYNQYPDNAASDADLDVAMALLMAECRWNDAAYRTEALTVIDAIRTHMFMMDGAVRVLQPGDSSWFDDLGNGCVNYSYFAPAYYRVFATVDTANAAFWSGAAADVYTLLDRASNATTGLVRNWGSSAGGDATCTTYNRPSSYGDDAARVPWRIALDYLWFGTADAKEWTDRVTTWVDGEGIEDTVQWYTLAGAPDTAEATWADHTVINVGPWAVGAMTKDQATLDAFAAEVVAIPSGPGNHDGEYFPRMLKALSLLTLTGGLTQCGGL